MAITKKNRREFIEDMFFKLENVPVEQIVGSRIPLKQQGAHLYGSCPFHSSTHHRSFVVTPRKNIWQCFVCGDGFGGNGIKFISLYDNIDYLQAAFKVAYENNIISYDEYIMYSKINYNETYVNRLEQKHVGSKKIAIASKPKAPDFIIHNVYSIIKENCSLSEEDYKTLKNERHLSDTRIARDYFTAPTNWKQKENILNAIRAAYPEYSDEILMTVPGFYIETEKGKNRLKFFFSKGIAFCIRTDTKIKAIQIRRYTVKEGQKRYTWFSSTFTDEYPDKYLGGAGCGSPHDILYPDNTDRGIIAITEGRFKSENYVYNEETRTYTLMETEWLKWRRHGPYHDHPEDARYIDVTLGGSDIAVLFDGSELAESLYLYEGQHGSNFKASVELFYEKTGRKFRLVEKKNADVLWVGHNEEPSIRNLFKKKFQDEHPMDIVEVINDCHMYQCGARDKDGKLKYPFVLCDLDGIVKINGVAGILECKTCNIGSEDYRIWKSGKVPLKYYLQCCYYMLCMNLPYAYICVKWGISPQECAYMYIERNFEVEEMIIDMAEKFIQCVKTNTPPDLKGQNMDRLFVFWRKKMGNASSDVPPKDLPDSYKETILQLSYMNDEIKAANKTATEIKERRNNLLAEKIFPVMGNANEARVSFNEKKDLVLHVRDKSFTNMKIDTKRLQEEDPDIYRMYLITKTEFDQKRFVKENPDLVDEYMIEDDTLTDGKMNFCDVNLQNKLKGAV